MGAFSESEVVGLLARNPLLEVLGADRLSALIGHAHSRHCDIHEAIFYKGDPGDSMMAVLAGRVKIGSTSADGKEVVFNIINTGEIFGELALLDGKDRSADAVAIEPVELLVLHRRDFLPYLRQEPELCMRMFAVLCDRLRATSEQVEDLMLHQSARLAKRLLFLAERFGRETKDGILIDIKMPQGELAKQVGMRREGLNRQLSQWRDAGIVAMEDHMIVVKDRTRLERAVFEGD